jgi:hypothetical protein
LRHKRITTGLVFANRPSFKQEHVFLWENAAKGNRRSATCRAGTNNGDLGGIHGLDPGDDNKLVYVEAMSQKMDPHKEHHKWNKTYEETLTSQVNRPGRHEDQHESQG